LRNVNRHELLRFPGSRTNSGTLPDSEIGKLFLDAAKARHTAGAFRVSSPEDIWSAVRHFFSHQTEKA